MKVLLLPSLYIYLYLRLVSMVILYNGVYRLICKDSVISRSSDLNSDPSITRISSSDLEKISVRFLRYDFCTESCLASETDHLLVDTIESRVLSNKEGVFSFRIQVRDTSVSISYPGVNGIGTSTGGSGSDGGSGSSSGNGGNFFGMIFGSSAPPPPSSSTTTTILLSLSIILSLYITTNYGRLNQHKIPYLQQPGTNLVNSFLTWNMYEGPCDSEDNHITHQTKEYITWKIAESLIDRIARVAFETIRKRGTKLCSVDKANDYSLHWSGILFCLLNGCMQNMASTKLNSSAPLHGVVRLALRTSTFNCSAAQKHIGYSPVVSLELSQLLPKLDDFMRCHLSNWDNTLVDNQQKTKEMAFLSSLNQIASIEWESMSGEFMPEFFKLVLGNPFSAYQLSRNKLPLQQENIVSMLRRLVEERRACQETKHDMRGLLMNGGEENRY
ncbi:unnamed protein product [Camellia sinensis]